MEDAARFCPNCGTSADAEPATQVLTPEAPVTPAPTNYNTGYNAAPVNNGAAYNPAPNTYNPAPNTYNPAPNTYNPAPNTYTPAQPNPYNNPYTNPYPTYQQEAPAELPTAVKVKGFVGMGLGIGSLALSVLGIIYTLAFMGSYYGEAFGAAIGFGIFSLPCGIVGKLLAGQSSDAGNTGAPCSVGSKLGLAGIIVSAVMLFLGFISLAF